MKSANSQRSGERYSHTKSERYIYDNTGGGLGSQSWGYAAAAVYEPMAQYTTFDYADGAVDYAPSFHTARLGKRKFIPEHWVEKEEA